MRRVLRARLDEDLGRRAPDDRRGGRSLFFALKSRMSWRSCSARSRLVFPFLTFVPLMRVTYLLSNTAGIGLIAARKSAIGSRSLLLEHAGLLRGRVRVVRNRIPRAEHDVVEAGERDEVLDQRRALVGALAEADRRHLRERADRLRVAAANALDAGHERRGDGAEAGREDAELAAWRDANVDGAVLTESLHELFSFRGNAARR